MKYGAINIGFTYDVDGLRTSKTIPNVGLEHKYYYVGNRLQYETLGGSSALWYFYDADGNPSGIRYKDNSGTVNDYYFVCNWRGDVVQIYNASGTLVGSYTYDAWGKVTENATSADTENITETNPIRYRGYYYDTETRLYYVNSRYYDPQVKRFVNSDSVISDTQGLLGMNLFSYCGNNPANRSDELGQSWTRIKSWFKSVGKKIERYLNESNVYGATISGITLSIKGLATSLKNAIKNSNRPKNIGAGTFAKQSAKDMAMVSRFEKVASTVLSISAYVSVAIDVGVGIADNIDNGATKKKIILDSLVDLTVSGGSIWLAGTMGSAVGTAVGTVLPGIGNVVGAGAGFVIGIGLYALTDMATINGKNLRTWAKEGVNSL